jgi:hypothetical protein
MIELRDWNDVVESKAISNIIKLEIKALISDCKDYETEPFDYLLGGNIFVVEVPEDLKEITSINPITERDINLYEEPFEFDIANNFKREPETVALILFTNNSGGNMYIAPENIHPHVLRSIVLSNQYEQDANPISWIDNLEIS